MASRLEKDFDGSSREWDDETRTFTTRDENGVITQQRPYTATENAQADRRDELSGRARNRAQLHADMEAEIDRLLNVFIPMMDEALAEDEATFQANAFVHLRRVIMVGRALTADLIALARITVDAVDSIDTGA